MDGGINSVHCCTSPVEICFFGITSQSDSQPDHAQRWLTKLTSELVDGGKVIFVEGIDCASNMALSTCIHQKDDERQKPLQELITLPGTEIMMAGHWT